MQRLVFQVVCANVRFDFFFHFRPDFIHSRRCSRYPGSPNKSRERPGIFDILLHAFVSGRRRSPATSATISLSLFTI